MNDEKLTAFLEKLIPFLDKRIEEAQAEADEFSGSEKVSDSYCYTAAVAVRGEAQTILDFVISQMKDDPAVKPLD